MVEKGECKALARQALRLLEDDALAQNLIENARKSGEENYTWENVREKWVQIYSKLGKGETT
jgi:glycosyltransferase involved in cell wall biosynthesis